MSMPRPVRPLRAAAAALLLSAILVPAGVASAVTEGGADLAITKSGEPEVIAGSTFSYTFDVTNEGDSANEGGYTVEDVLPAGLDFVSGTGCSSDTVESDEVVTCVDTDGIGIGAEESESFSITVTSSPSLAPGESALSNTASVAPADPETDPDGNASNDESTYASDVIARADLSITKTATAQVEDDLAYANANAQENRVEFSIEVSNAEQSEAGPSDAQNVVVTDVLPAGTTFVSASEECSHDEGTVECATEGPLAPGDDRTYSITVSVDADLRGGEENNFTNTADVESDTPNIDGDEYPTTSDPTDPETRVHTVPDAPTNVHTESGNTNAVVTWTPTPPTANGGESVDRYVVTFDPQTAQPGTCPTPGTLTTVVRFASGANADTLDSGANSLRNGCVYDVEVQAENEVGLSDAAPSDTTATPSRDKSAEILGNGNNEQFTGGGNTTNADLFVVKQSGNFATGTIGTLQEVTTGQPSDFPSPSEFCGGLPCAGDTISVNKFTDPTNGRYLLELRYGKQVTFGTGQKRVYFSSDPDDPTGHQIFGCPKKGQPIPATTDACIVKLTANASKNPAVLVLLSVRPDLIDPAAGTRR